ILGNSLINWRFQFSRGKSLLSKSWPLILSSVGTIIYLKIDQIMLGEMIGKEAVGNYAVAAKISEIWYFIPTAVASSVFPSLLKSRENNIKAYKNKLQKLYDNLACLALLIALPITIVSTPVITMLYGEVFREAGLILSIHIWASVFIFMRAALSKWLIAEDLYVFSLVTHGLGAIVNALLNLFLIPNFGGIGAAIATLISYATASYFALFVHSRTVETARMMTLALIFPVRFLLKKTAKLS
ncbi:MAG: flippase, partial [Cyanobacteria bacterium J06632_19]